MQENWKNWCRLCGSSEITIKLEGSSILQYHFKITENNIKICEECNSYVSGFEEFLGRSENVQALFQELSNTKEALDLQELNELRRKFNLKAIKVSTKLESDASQERKNAKIADHEFNFDHLHEQFSNDSDSEAETKQKEQPEVHYIPEISLEEEPLQHSKKKKHLKRKRKMVYKESSEEEDDVKIKKDPDGVEEEAQTSSKSIVTTNETPSKGTKTQRITETKRQPYFSSEILPAICHICRELCQSMIALEKHTKEYHDCTPQILCVCGLMITTNCTYTRHRKKCFGAIEAPYQCDQCPMRYFGKRDLEAHLKQRHSSTSKRYICSTCGKEFELRYKLKKHEVIHIPEELREKFYCPHDQCSHKALTKCSLTAHIKKTHTVLEKTEICPSCGKFFASKHLLNSHLESHRTTLDFCCELCAMKFKTKGSLQNHMKAHGPKSHFCKICGMGFRRGSLVTKHMVIHSDARPFKCPYDGCGKDFKRKSDLKIHVNSSAHLNLQTHQCSYCKQTFSRKRSCWKHKEMVHPAEFEIEKREKESKRTFINSSIVDQRYE